MQNAENISEYLLLRHQGLQQSIQSLQSHITSLLADIREIADCQEQMTTDVRLAMEEIDTKRAGDNAVTSPFIQQIADIRKPLAARQALTRSEAVLQKSLDITEEADLALRNAMARIK